MKIQDLVDLFCGDIYFKPTSELMSDYTEIISKCNDAFLSCGVDAQLTHEYLNYAFVLAQNKDFLKMAEFLHDTLKPIMDSLEESDG